jgi:hypothetical protein
MDKVMKSPVVKGVANSPIVKGTADAMKTRTGLYVILFLAVTNVLGFITMNNVNALVLFVIVGVVASRFTKNMSYILATSLVVTNGYLLVQRKMSREGMKASEDKEDPAKPDDDDIIETPEIMAIQAKIPPKGGVRHADDDTKTMDISGVNIDASGNRIDQDIQQLAPLSYSTRDNDKASNGNKARGGNNVVGGTETKNTDKKDGFVSKNQRLSPGSLEPKKKSSKTKVEDDDTRVDYASTLEMAYDNLQTMLGDEGIKGLSSETRRLAKQQQNLIASLNDMAPILKDAQSTLTNLKMPDMNSMKSIMGMLKGRQ